MREILFRAKTVDDNCWHYGDIFHSSANPSQTRIHDYENHVNFEAIEDTLGQYTGLTDRNGVRIFEGDILQSTESGMKALVQYFSEHGAFMLWCRDESTNQIEYIGEVEMLMVEVIGNIHDNIELFPEYAGGDDNAVD